MRSGPLCTLCHDPWLLAYTPAHPPPLQCLGERMKWAASPTRAAGRHRHPPPQTQPLLGDPTHPPQESPGVAPGSAAAPAPAPRSPLPAGPPDAAESPAPGGKDRVRQALLPTAGPRVLARSRGGKGSRGHGEHWKTLWGRWGVPGVTDDRMTGGHWGSLTAWASPKRVRSNRFSRWVSCSRAQRS